MQHASGNQPSAVSSLGDPIGSGRTAEVFAWGEDRVVKLLRPGFPDRLGEHEATNAAAVARAAVGAPQFFGTTRIDGRLGVVYERIHGASLLDRLAGHPFELDRLARRFAELHAALHEAGGSGLSDQKAEIRGLIEQAGAELPDHHRQAALRRLAALPPGDALCHGDMHPGNVLLEDARTVVIDWLTASAGSPAGDVAQTLVLLRHGAIPPSLPPTQRSAITLARQRFSNLYLRHYRTLRQLDDRELRGWRLPTLAARLGEGIEEERVVLLAQIQTERDLDPEVRPA